MYLKYNIVYIHKLFNESKKVQFAVIEGSTSQTQIKKLTKELKNELLY